MPNPIIVRPTFVVKNCSSKSIRALGQCTIKPGDNADLFVNIDGLSESTVIDELRQPDGTLYNQIYVDRSLQLLECTLLSFSNPVSVVQQVFASTEKNIQEPIKTDAPLTNNGNLLSMPKADQNTSGYLSNEDWTRFNRGVDTNIIWQYQDFAIQTKEDVCITRFDNGNIDFNSHSILDSSAVLTTIDGKPFKVGFWKKKTIEVVYHNGADVRLSQIPNAEFRLWYLVEIDKTMDLDKYATPPEFVRRARADMLKLAELPSVIIGNKTFTSNLYINGKIGVKTDMPMADLDISGSLKVDKLILSDNAAEGFTLTSNSMGQVAWNKPNPCGVKPPSAPYDGQIWIKQPSYEIFTYCKDSDIWIGTQSIQLSGATILPSVSNTYLSWVDGIQSLRTSIIMPFDAELSFCSTECSNKVVWSLEIHANGQLVDGLMFNHGSAFIPTHIVIPEGAKISLFARGTNICMPHATVIFRHIYR